MAVWLILNEIWKSKMGVSVKIANVLGMLSLLLVTGQAVASESWTGRFYPGDPRPAGEVALLVGHVGGWDSPCPYFSELTKQGEWHKSLSLWKTLAEVLPGHYTVHVACDSTRAINARSARVEIDAEAGHVYYIAWWADVLQVVDIASDGDYKRQKHTAWVRPWVEKYFRGKRHEVKEERVSERNTAWF
jgi:hypothetical protein